MATWIYVGRTRSGDTKKGEVSAKSKEDAQAQLRKQNILATSIQKKASSIEIPGMGPVVTEKDVVIYTRQFSTMIDAGLPLVQCLEILGSQCENPALAKVIQATRIDVEAGSTYADALRKHPKAFDELYVNMIAAGETGGILDIIQQRLAAHMEKAIALKKQIKGALVYPIAIVSIAIVVIAVLMIFVIPVFASMFDDFGGTLPGPTQFVMDLSDFFVANVWYMIAAFMFLKWGIKTIYTKTVVGRREMDRMFLKIPVMGDVIRKASVAKFTRTLSTLIQSGVPILEGMLIVATTAGNKIVEEAIMTARVAISEGQDVAPPLEASKVFPKMVTQMIAVGEATGAMDVMLSKIADFYDQEVDDAVGALTALMEPALMVFLGVTVGFIVVAMYLPIFTMAASVG
ncbi:MAG: type II secretion system F family protein [Nitrospirota bacterium]|nr:type II secretion system F family protein [Nitrospirota bacterium]